MPPPSFVSFRTSPDDSASLKRLAAERGVSLQRLMQELVRERLDRGRGVPVLAEVIATLRGRKDELVRRGVTGLWVFGSVARGTVGPESDVDLVAEIAATPRLSLTGFARLKADLADWLGCPVDLVEWRTLGPHVAETARREAVSVF